MSMPQDTTGTGLISVRIDQSTVFFIQMCSRDGRTTNLNREVVVRASRLHTPAIGDEIWSRPLIRVKNGLILDRLPWRRLARKNGILCRI